MSKVIVTRDNFIWKDVTAEVDNSRGFPTPHRQWYLDMGVYALHEDESDTLLESEEELKEALKLGLRVVQEVGYMPRKQKRKWFFSADKQLIDGYWYVKIADLDFEN
ncbi:MAG: hypothetical protein ACTSPB_26390 [Candidatus Thorarchaeota archaeon]|jgi:hypothetical protein